MHEMFSLKFTIFCPFFKNYILASLISVPQKKRPGEDSVHMEMLTVFSWTTRQCKS